jgi:hypothetical protein
MKPSSFSTLRRFAGAPRLGSKRNGAAPPQEIEQCELCSIRLAPTHRHLLEMATRRIVCACDPCALRFENVLGENSTSFRATRGRFRISR